jgi:kinesin family protein C2/C3
MEKETMGGHVMLPLENLGLDVPNGEILLGHDKDMSTLQGSDKHHSLVY